MDKIHEYIVVGSGPSGAQAAETLLENGKQVTMLDVGFTDERYSKDKPDSDFVSSRKNDPTQYEHFIGKDFEGFPSKEIKVGAQLTPARKYMIREVEKLIPLESSNFLPMESLGYGGLGIGWGLGCYTYSSEELTRIGLESGRMHDAYQVIADRIGISGPTDEFSRHVLGELSNIQPPLLMDNNIRTLLDTYTGKKDEFNKAGVHIGHPSMALLTKDLDDRSKTKYLDMDFYSDTGLSAYRPWITLDKLKRNKNFTYMNRALVTEFKNEENHVVVRFVNVHDNTRASVKCRKLVLACGALGTGRIVLRSFREQLKRLPLLCNPYTYMSCLNARMLGTPLSRYKTSLAQAMMIYDPDGRRQEMISVALYTYRSLMLFRLVNEIPLGIKDSTRLLHYLQSAFVVAGIHHPDEPSINKYLELRKDHNSITGDHLFVDFQLAESETNKIRTREKTIRKYLRKLGCHPLKRVNPGYGGSIHYAGTVPFDKDQNKIGTIQPDGRVNGASNVFIADGSGFRFLPAKGPTLSFMANAHCVAKNSIAA